MQPINCGGIFGGSCSKQGNFTGVCNMAGESDTLTAMAIKTTMPGKHFDGGGLYLHVQPGGRSGD